MQLYPRRADVGCAATRASAGRRQAAPPFGDDREPLEDHFWRLSGRLMQLANHKHGYKVQAGHEITQAVGVWWHQRRQRPRFQLRRI
jgi:hypothetical protein